MGVYTPKTSPPKRKPWPCGNWTRMSSGNWLTQQSRARPRAQRLRLSGCEPGASHGHAGKLLRGSITETADFFLDTLAPRESSGLYSLRKCLAKLLYVSFDS